MAFITDTLTKYWEVIVTVITIAIVLNVILVACSYLIWVERKLSAWMQDRVGPNRVGIFGLLQPIADGLKFLFKEEVIPSHVDKVLFVLAPCITLFTTMLAFAVVPFGPVNEAPEFMRFIIAPNIDIGLVFIFAISSLAVYGVILGGWASNNKYSALGSLRASAQVVSYEIPLGMSVLGIALLGGTLSLEQIQAHQATAGFTGWYFWTQPLACLIFFTSALAESNRLPFDLSECEQELVGGFHTEYSALKFGLFFLGEYTHVITISFLTAILFFGGWQFPWIAEADSVYPLASLVKMLVLLGKVLFIIVIIMMIRWTIPRFRFDQLMGLTWKVFIPLALMNVVMVMTVKQFNWSDRWLFPLSLALFAGAGVISVSAKQRELQNRVQAPQKSLAAHGHETAAAH
ncbi:NADH-quinone oxidoreductase subunit NuoH [Planctomicrobium piriforme]|uniref:NADH-quinone oxidoreductase subunit H n=1 Tax=Planctomicrobium piriforme TaxID=1576369 RepID=A0A1I3QRK3_9PLAN|nr:NADH-quinone oxidoreductase subunit NuoH [Planctomicrobium piriforme]SFJ36515.1 NADH-quinone oxidoreductase subunit H [Planctomicrobium piriforme]